MRSILGYVRTTENTLIDVGCRSLALATGEHYATTSRLLRILETNSQGILTRIGRGRGRNADQYAVQLPEQFEQLARELPWRKGKIYGIRPVFRVLGNVAALAYEGIERARHCPTTSDLARTTGISRNTLSDHLSTMENLGMIRRHHGAWQINATANLRQLADRLGATDDFSSQLTRYRKERAAWHAWLDRHHVPQLAEHELYEADVDEYWLPPIDDDHELHRTLWNAARQAA
ncbi:helix-turn-helix domain-containing protein [Vibrio cholerae]|nr:helix-turn-helix domain-containing protein [Vibrio cholerae]